MEGVEGFTCLLDGLARILTRVEEFGIWPDWLLDAGIAMIPKSDGDSTPLGQRPLSVLPIVYRVWASARMNQLGHWFKSWVPDSVFSAGGGRGSVEAWYTSALDIEEVLAVATDSHVHLVVADVIFEGSSSFLLLPLLLPNLRGSLVAVGWLGVCFPLVLVGSCTWLSCMVSMVLILMLSNLL